MPVPQRMIVYNLFPLLAGTFTGWKSHLERAAAMGFNWVFVNPIQLPGASGSLYSIKDYFAFNPLFVDPHASTPAPEQMREVARSANELGLNLMVDLVVNHCASDSELLSLHPGWFEWERPGVVAHPHCNQDGRRVVWQDLAKFDHRKTQDPEGLYRFFLQVVRYLVELGFRGFRCDAAYQVPKAFWSRLIRKVKSEAPGTVFAAETLGCTADQTRKTASAGFDFIFNSSKWWDFKSHWLMMHYNLTREAAPSIGFPESHDTKRLCDELKGNVSGLKQRYLFASFFSSGTMMTVGYEYGFRKKPHVVHTRPQDWEHTAVDLTDYIRSVNRMKSAHPILQEEAPQEILHEGNPNVLVMWKGSLSTESEALLILNKDILDPQLFTTGRLQSLVQSGTPLMDISPEQPLEHIPEPFSYQLRPGQGLVFVAACHPAPAD